MPAIFAGVSAGTLAGVAGAAVSAGTAIAGAVGGGSSQSSDISSGLQAATAAQQNAYNEYASNEAPFMTTGTSALSAQANADGLNGAAGNATALADFQASPGYAYDLQQGLSAIDNGAASTGTLRSGNTIRAEQTLGNNLADQDFSQYVSRLSGLSTLGQTATSGLGSAGVSTGQGIAGSNTSAATAQSNITGNTTSSVSNALSGLAGNKNVQSTVTSALSNLGSSSSGSGYANANPAFSDT